MRYKHSPFVIQRVAAVACGAVSLLLSNIAVGQQGKTLPVFGDGQAQVVPGFQDSNQWIRQQIWVETEFDSDNDGKRDRVHVDVTRPRQTETEGLKVPVIYESSPYYPMEHGVPPKLNFWNVNQEVGAVPSPRTLPTAASVQTGYASISMSHMEWVRRGFAVVHSESPGTGLSQGCPTVGGDNEALAPKAVIDWLNGRARGFTTADGNEQVMASWSTGKVGMTGTSYNGTLALAAATTGVKGLVTIMPVAPVSSYYDYYRSNGLVRNPGGYAGEDVDVLFDFINSGPVSAHCATIIRDSQLAARNDRTSGDYNDFWASRDYVAKVKNIKASVWMVHAFNDWNVMPEQSVRMYEALKQQHVPIRAFYDQGGHGGGGPSPEMVLRWFTHYLYDVQNGVEKEPRFWLVQEDAKNASPTPYADYPNPAAVAVTFYPKAGGGGVGGLDVAKHTGQGKETLSDDATLSAKELAQAAQSNHRLLYATPILTESMHLSGWSTISTRLASSTRTANLSVYLVAIDSESKIKLLTRGWADPQNHASLTHGEPLVPGQFYPMSFRLQPEDQIIPAGSRLALMIFSSDKSFTLLPRPGTELTIDLDATSVVLPLVGGASALHRALEPAGSTKP